MSEVSEADSSKSPRVYKILLMVLPVGVVVGTIIFMFMYFYMERQDEKKQTVIVSHGLRVKDLEDMVDKFSDRIGERNIETEQGRDGLKGAASMIEGRLGPLNLGLTVSKSEGEAAHGLLWKSLSVEILGEKNPEEVVFAAVSFSGPGKVADANSVSTMMMLASAVAREKPDRTLRFVFLPMNRPDTEQNRWLVERCLKPSESCVGIIGLKTMDKAPVTGESEWRVNTPSPVDQAWWKYLSTGSSEGKFSGGRMPSVWITHPVFSPDTWVGKKDERLDRTMVVAQELRKWLQKATDE